MKKMWAVVLVSVIMLLPCRAVLAREESPNHYYILCKSGEEYSAYPIDTVLEGFQDDPAWLFELFSQVLDDIWVSLPVEKIGLEPFGLLMNGVTQELKFPTMISQDLKLYYPVFLNSSHLTVGNIPGVNFLQGLYLLESSLKIDIETLPGYGKVAVQGNTLLDSRFNDGLFHFSSQGSLVLTGNSQGFTLPSQGGNVTSLVQSCSSQLHNYQLRGNALMQRELALGAGQGLSLEPGGTLELLDGLALTLGRGALFYNKGNFGGVIRNQGRVDNARGAIIGGSHFYNLTEGQVYNAGVVTSALVSTQKGSVIRNLDGGRLTAVPTGEGEFPGKISGEKPVSDGSGPPSREETIVPPRQDSASRDDDDDDNSLSDPYISLPDALVSGLAPKLDKAQVVAATKTAIEQAGQQDRQAVVRLPSPGALDAEALKALWGEEEKFPLVLYAFSPEKDGKGVGVRLTVKPSALTEPCSLEASMDNEQALKTQELFEYYFAGNVRVVSLTYQGNFAKPVEVAARLNLSGIDSQRLFFYAYQPTSNTYREIRSPQNWVDSKGFLHFYTSWGGDLLVTDVRLP